ncbi:hypothetical protein PRUPE_7G077000 [Prunus persica]|uniref:PREDICTED: POPTR_0016s04490g n=2 Tax=Prunus TaxID=3754 RepID=A0A5E4F9Z1_PRUDU|nr:uncharacterized protein LOC18771404 [Prunus persica]XP_034225021.1 uncharacterized protein LOC117634863 [Prunus dulcis]KAI5318614.1 hypothetical protein L3X38_038322 [Prunus dulcis]ONH95555.1 hypothetical protein PRUPE_7G077000 [Prunus persica]VVA24913.1 PREDICTED: POPTR_0016s04490g [Prunus dulcis]
MDPLPTPTPTPTPAPAATSASVQHVNKKSSDELLRKFADSGDEAEEAPEKKQVIRVSKRRKVRNRASGEGEQCESPSNGKNSLVERRSLLPAAGTKNKALLRQLGVHGRASQLRARDIRNKSFFGAIHKTWRRTIEGASKVFMEKHYNRHKRLISDIA